MINTDNLDGAKASYVTLAASIYGNDIVLYGCSFDGWQDTLPTGATTGYQHYESCYIGGAIDFIWGYSKAYFKGCTVGAKRTSSAITAHSRASFSAVGGYIFDDCLFTTALALQMTLRIRSTLGARTPQFNNSGPSNWENNAAARQAFGFATLLTSDTYSLSSVMDSTEWIDTTYWISITTPFPATAAPTGPTNITVGRNPTFDGTTPPTGALVVSKSPVTRVTTYQTIQDAMNAAPTARKTNATIFIYPGVYNEQLIVNKSGTTIFMGYSSATDDYSANQVSIKFSHGIDTQGTDGSDTDGATVYVTGNYFYAYNINFRNTAGTTQNIASLGFAVKSSKFAALYGCQIYGNQDTLNISGHLFTFKTYIEGNIDFVFGNGAAYFLDSTISPNEDGVSITAFKRTTNSTAAGLVFDQCTLKPAPGMGPFKDVGLGRPWNNNARVAFVDCYLDSMISGAGWNQWSKSSPQTDGVVFGEYRNYGHGSNVCDRASFSQQLSDADVVQFQLGNFFASTKFIDFSHVDTQPFTVGIGSAQTCATVISSVILASSTFSSSGTFSSSAKLSLSSLLSSSTLSSSSSLPVATVYTTVTAVDKLTASSTFTQPDATSTTVVKLTSTASLTGAVVVKTEVEKSTATLSIMSPDITSASTFIVTENDGLTITPAAVTKNNVVKVTTTIDSTTTAKVPTSTLTETTTTTIVQTLNPKPTTITQSKGSNVTILSNIAPKGASTTIKTTISKEPSSTKTTTIKAKNSVTISTVSLKTVTKKTTTTESCIFTEAARMVRRGAVIPRAVASTTTITVSTTVTSFVRTVTATLPGSTTLVTETSVAKIKTYTQPGGTSTVSLTPFVNTITIAQPGSTYLTTVTSTEKIGKITTLKASTTTILSTSRITKQQVQTVTPETVTVSSLRTCTST
ncbi:Pectinesterase [Ascochyta rabiei]|uniref:Pectinesterase n=1 Tax=Didymella rabiei TaxID=5454 RepID=UPI0021FF3DF7|nr:Pectinesterase [Ascochyta rabiei]UPX19919.1 Pectinesterase [Ascochyta rabiei]